MKQDLHQTRIFKGKGMTTKRKLGLVAAISLIAIMAVFAWFGWVNTQVIQSQGIMSSNYGKGPSIGVVGHLGGVPVSIPPGFAHFVEYDSDPGFGEARKGVRPKNTFQSGIRGFGFEIRYPDMVPLVDSNLAEKKKETFSSTPWIRVGINSNSNYGYAGNDKTARFANNSLESAKSWHRYELLPDKPYGLSSYIPVDADPSRREIDNPKGRDRFDLNLYVHQSKDGVIDSYIACDNMNYDASCRQFFVLNPTMKAWVSVNYRKGLLPHWREIQDGIGQVFLGFRVNQPPETNQSRGPKGSEDQRGQSD